MILNISDRFRRHSMSGESSNAVQLVHDCDNLMKNSRLSLYGEVAILRPDAQTAQSNVSLLNKLRTDLSFLVERLSSTEKLTYLRCCENEKEARAWDSTEP
jgi:hypothetical protein